MVCGDAVVSYGELAVRAARLARLLAELGAGPETVVGLCLDRGAGMVTAIVGAWLAGAAYLPLDPGWPAVRLGYMLAASRAGLVVCRGGLPAGLDVPPQTAVADLDDPRWPGELAGLSPVCRRCRWRAASGVCDLHLGIDRGRRTRWRSGTAGW